MASFKHWPISITPSIEKELNKWDKRVYYDFKFKEDTTAAMDRLYTIVNDYSIEKFVCISASSESLVYKIGRYLIQSGKKNSSISFIDGRILETYMCSDSIGYKKRELIDALFSLNSDSIKNKWVFIPYLDFPVDINSAIYFINKVKLNKALGMVIFGEGPKNLAEILCRDTNFPFVYQFSKNLYTKSHKQIVNDEY